MKLFSTEKKKAMGLNRKDLKVSKERAWEM